MGSGNGQHRSRRHRQEKKDGATLVAQQSTQQVPKTTGQPKPHSEPKSTSVVNGNGIAPGTPPINNGAPEKNSVTPTEEPAVAAERPLPPPPMMKTSRHTGQNTPTPRGDLTDMLDALRALFVHDRAIGSRPDAARCGVCYLTFTQEEVIYREEEGFYVCADCAKALGAQRLPMLRRQKR